MALLRGNLRVQGSEHHTLPLRLRWCQGRGLLLFSRFLWLWFIFNNDVPPGVLLLIPLVCMSNHLIKIQICQIAVQF